jgi:hypothetical protein
MKNGTHVQRVSVYRVVWKPLPKSKEAARMARYEGYFYCLEDLHDHARLLSDLLLGDECEIIDFKFSEVGEIGKLLGKASTRTRIDEKGYALKLGTIVPVA